MNLFQIMDLCTGEMQVVVSAVKTIFTLIQIAIPAVLIILGTVDMFKAMASGDEKRTKESQRIFIRRLIYAVVAFLIPFIVRLIFNFVADNIGTAEGKAGRTAYDKFFACWNGASGSGDSTAAGCYSYDVNGNKHSQWPTDPDTCRENGYSWE